MDVGWAARVVAGMLTGYLGAAPGERALFASDQDRIWFGEILAVAAETVGVNLRRVAVTCPESLEECRGLLKALDERDLVIAAFSGREDIPYGTVFAPFRRPGGFPGRSAFVRERVPDRALLDMLSTDADDVAERVSALLDALGSGGRFRLTAPGGTDLTFDARESRTLPWRALAPGQHAYLPPSEVYAGIEPGSAEGTLVVDVTAGEVVVEGRRVDALGLVDSPVTAVVSGGCIQTVQGGEVAARLARCLVPLSRELRLVVEVGFGLSSGQATGLISVDECLAGTGHVGIGNDLFFGGSNDVPMHLDLVMREPVVERLSGEE